MLGAARRVSARATLALMVVAAVLLSLLGVSSTVVGAVTTDASRVDGNRFAAAVRVDIGIVDLAVTPSSGELFGPGPDTGEVTFGLRPAPAAPVELLAGEEIAAVVTLPAGSTPGELPALDTGNGYRRSWTSQENGGIWTVRSVLRATADGLIDLPGFSFPVHTDFTTVTQDSARTATASVELPERLTSDMPEGSVVIPAAWGVKTGVYGLGGTLASTSSATIRFQTQPSSAAETLYLQAGEILRTTVVLPAGVTPGTLPAPSSSGGIDTVWRSERIGADWAVTHTRTATAAVEAVPNAAVTFPVRLTSAVAASGFEISASAYLPPRFTSAQASAIGEVSGLVSAPKLGRISAGGGQSMALAQSGSAYGSGYNVDGRVGNGTRNNVLTPAPLGYQDFVQLSAGGSHTLGLGSDLRVYGWGSAQYALTGGTNALKPVQVSSDGMGPFTQVSAGYDHSLALGSNGRAYGWGRNQAGALGALSSSTWPTALENPSGVQFVQLEAGVATTMGLASDGSVWGMGDNRAGQLGLGTGMTQTTKFTRIPMPDDVQIVQLASNSSTTLSHTIALTSTGDLIAWGANSGGQAGTALDGSRPQAYSEPTRIQAPAGVRFTRVAAGNAVSLALGTDGKVYSWGSATQGVPGGGASAIPRQVALPHVSGGFTDIAAGDMHAFALGANNQLYGWGAGTAGRLGNNNTAYQTTPVLLPQSLTRAEAVTDDAPALSEIDEISDAPEDVEVPAEPADTEDPNASEEDGTEADSDSAENPSDAGATNPAAGDERGSREEELGEARPSLGSSDASGTG